eukprot:gene187-216_t
MELDETNKGQVKRLFAFLKGKRDRHLKELAEVAADVKDDKCGDDMTIYNQDDLLQQAQQMHVQLAADISIIEDESRLATVAELAEWQGNAPVPKKHGNLAALGGEGGGGSAASANLAQKVQDLESENKMLQDRYQAIQKQ